jgi:hypothetical protein
VAQDQLFDLRGRAIEEARTAVRRARERAGTAVPVPSLPGPHPRSVSYRAGTVEAVPRGALAQPAPAHGTRARYNLKRSPCRCRACCQANTRYIRSYRHRNDGPTLALTGRDVVDVPVKGRVL